MSSTERLAKSPVARMQKNISEGEIASEETVKVSERYSDESYKLLSRVKAVMPTEEEARVIRNKCIKWILPFFCFGYHMMYVDKQALGSSSTLGILTDANLNSNQGVILLLHIPCRNFASLFIVRFILGLAEACIITAFLIILSMFFTYDEQAVLMPIMWASDNSSPITSGLLSYGVLWIKRDNFPPWKWFMVICGGLTILFGVLVWLFFPNSPVSARFLTKQERAQAIMRIKSNNSVIEQKRFKNYQFIEAMKDLKTWLFILHAWSQEMANGLTNQYSLIIQSFGFTTLQTTLLGCVNGITALISLGAAAIFLAKTTNTRAWLSAAAYIPPIISCILLISLPWSNRWGLLTAIWIRATGGIPYAVVMIWAANCSAGHTKKTAVISLYHVGYGLGNILSPQLFQAQYKPRYIVTWSVILGVACILPMAIVLYLRWYLIQENRRRDDLASKGLVMDVGILEHEDGDSDRRDEVFDARQLDLTDKENLAL